ncbi:hypothetical protein PSEUDO8Z_160057 [Pseudomonas sp. 8Z]|nr:hypothetical protein PSEUDO8Z_160057 [Pseudomonas sp. 8Z]
MVEGARLESVYTGNRIKSSNLFFTATFAIPKALKANKFSGLFAFQLSAGVESPVYS